MYVCVCHCAADSNSTMVTGNVKKNVHETQGRRQDDLWDANPQSTLVRVVGEEFKLGNETTCWIGPLFNHRDGPNKVGAVEFI